ncbi:hypothetical protein AGMMS49579_13640 [Spirochaetia bacterium]|nr:hypothetical protein AGMMS49579_13640 [Spirochaetia bacterium]
MWSGSIVNIVESYISKEVLFRFRGIDFSFALSHGLFSSNDIDTGTRQLLRVLSKIWDADPAAGRPLPRSVLDSGCGVGVIGICAARALLEFYSAAGSAVCPPPFFVRAQDRDDLARLFTEYNAERNFPTTEVPVTARTEPLLAGPEGCRWDLILTNIPAKAGTPVLEDFVRRSVELLSPGGRVIMVAVNTLVNFFRSLIEKSGTVLLEETGKEHTVFVYQRREADTMLNGPVIAGEHFIQNNPFYLRSGAGGMGSGDYEMEGICYHIDAVHGAAEFDRPGAAAVAAAKLVSRLGLEKIYLPQAQSDRCAAILIHESGQGHFPAWLLQRGLKTDRLVLSGRNILALEAARHNTKAALAATALAAKAADMSIQVIPGTELPVEHPAIPGAYSFIVAFPETVPGAERLTALWEDIARLLLPNGTALIALSSSEAEKFDRKKPASGPNGPHFTRLGDIKRQGFRALAYRRNQDPV